MYDLSKLPYASDMFHDLANIFPWRYLLRELIASPCDISLTNDKDFRTFPCLEICHKCFAYIYS